MQTMLSKSTYAGIQALVGDQKTVLSSSELQLGRESSALKERPPS